MIAKINELEEMYQLEQENKLLREALTNSTIALDDWIRTFASELCHEKHVQESYERINQGGGTLYYIAVLQEANRNALKPK